MSERLQPGETAPAFTLSDADGNPVSLSDFAGRPVIVYFYPAAMTPGCTTQAIDFTAAIDDLDAALLPVESALELPQVQATDAGAARIMNGNPGQVIGHAEFGTEVWVSHEGRAIGIGRYMGGEVHPSRVFVRP